MRGLVDGVDEEDRNNHQERNDDHDNLENLLEQLLTTNGSQTLLFELTAIISLMVVMMMFAHITSSGCYTTMR